MTPKATDTSSDSKDTSSNNSKTGTDSKATDSKTPVKNNTGSGLVVAGRKSRKNK